uniref:LRAT domain-containing protein n=1 Tax=Panagrellus redivivus TaxID=6233 RepID=A0A7E4UP23_PANRE
MFFDGFLSCSASYFTSYYVGQQLIGSLVEIEGFVCHHWAVIVEVVGETVYVIHLTNDDMVRRSTLVDCAKGDRVRINNSWDNWSSPYAPETIVKRAQSKLGYCKYHTLTYNCETFATWCRNGDEFSGQTLRTLMFAPVTLPALGLYKLFGGSGGPSNC